MTDPIIRLPNPQRALRAAARHSLAILLATTALGVVSAHAIDGTWTGASSGDWSNGTNWTSSPSVPNGTATFANTGPTSVSNSAVVNINSIQFSAIPNAPAYTITVGNTFFVNGTGVFNNSTNTQTFDVPSNMVFQNSATGSGGTGLVTYNVSTSLAFIGTSTAGSAKIVNTGGATNFGVLAIGASDTATAANANIINNAGGFTNFYASTMAGSATITNNAGGTTQFFDATHASNATITNAVNGTTQFYSAYADNAVITNNGGLTQFNGSASALNATITTNSGGGVFFVGISSAGSATFVTNSGGAFNIAGLSTNGTTAGTIAGAGSYVLGAKNLTVGVNTIYNVGNNLPTVVSGVISGVGGSLYKVGTATLTLSGINTYTGPTLLNEGGLVVDGSIAASSLTTVQGGVRLMGSAPVVVPPVLSGSGTIGNADIGQGTLAPGSAAGGSFGPLTVAGSLSFTTASTYMIQVTPANAGRTNVTGTATLGNAAVNAVFAPGSYVSRQYTILNAGGGVAGTFNPAVTTNMANLNPTLTYDANDVFLNIKLNFVPPSGNLNVNQQNVANALTNFFNSTGGIPVAFANLSPAGLTQASGELATASQQTTFDAMNLFMGLLTDPFVAGRGDGPSVGGGSASGYADADALGYAARRKPNDALAAIYTKAPPLAPAFEQRWSVWAAGYGGSQTTDGNATLGSNNTSSSVYGTAVGADYRISPFTLAGFALAGGGTNFSVAGLGSGRSDLFQAGAFIRHSVGPAYILAALAYGWQDITTNRTVTLAGFDQLRAEFNANTYLGRVEGGYRFVTPWMGITPYAAGQFTTFDLPSYAEGVLSGANTFALAYSAKSVTDTRSELGLRTDKSFAVQDGILTLRSRFAWAHDFNPDRSIAATFQTLPGASFVVNGAAQAHDSALTTASAEMKWLNGFSVAATFEGAFSDVTNSYAGKGVVRYTW